MKFSVIIPTKQRKDILVQSLRRLGKANNLMDMQVIVINDDATELQLHNEFPFVSVYQNHGSGVASARNTGAGKASYEWLVFMDDDMLIQPDTFDRLKPFCTINEHCVNVNWVYPDFISDQIEMNPFLRYLHKYGFDSLQGWSSSITWKKDKPFQVDGITSQFLLIHKSIFYKVGGYNTAFPFAGFEDYDFSKRLTQKGVTIYVDPQNLIFHNEVDRIEIENWLERKKRGAVTRKVGVSLGYEEMALHYSFVKKVFYRLVYAFRVALLIILKKWPKSSAADQIYFFLVNVLLGTYSFIGYTNRKV